MNQKKLKYNLVKKIKQIPTFKILNSADLDKKKIKWKENFCSFFVTEKWYWSNNWFSVIWQNLTKKCKILLTYIRFYKSIWKKKII